jgi:hypothetical protein
MFQAFFYVTGPNQLNFEQKIQKKSWTFWGNQILVESSIPG